MPGINADAANLAKFPQLDLGVGSFFGRFALFAADAIPASTTACDINGAAAGASVLSSDSPCAGVLQNFFLVLGLMFFFLLLV